MHSLLIRASSPRRSSTGCDSWNSPRTCASIQEIPLAQRGAVQAYRGSGARADLRANCGFQELRRT